MNPTNLNESLVLDTLRGVIDPELGCNIVDLGLVYGVQIDGGNVRIAMTLTTAGCPMQESIALGVQQALLHLDRVTDVEVDVVWDPPWDPSMMTDAGRLATGARF